MTTEQSRIADLEAALEQIGAMLIAGAKSIDVYDLSQDALAGIKDAQ